MNRLLCWGMTSRIPHGKSNVVFLDYDHTPFEKVAKIAKRLQTKFGLSSAYIANTGLNRHHVVFLDQLPLDVWDKVIQDSGCHDGYRFHLDNQKYAILRLVKKGDNPAPIWKATLPKVGIWKQSAVHAMMLEKFWNLPAQHCRLDETSHNVTIETVYYFTDNPRAKA